MSLLDTRPTLLSHYYTSASASPSARCSFDRQSKGRGAKVVDAPRQPLSATSHDSTTPRGLAGQQTQDHSRSLASNKRAWDGQGATGSVSQPSSITPRGLAASESDGFVMHPVLTASQQNLFPQRQQQQQQQHGKLVYLGKKGEHNHAGSALVTSAGAGQSLIDDSRRHFTGADKVASSHAGAGKKQKAHKQQQQQSQQSHYSTLHQKQHPADFTVKTVVVPSGYVKGELEEEHIEHAQPVEHDVKSSNNKTKKKKKKSKAKAKMTAMLESIGAFSTGSLIDEQDDQPSPYMIEKDHPVGNHHGGGKHGHSHASHHGQHHSEHVYEDEYEVEERHDGDDRRGRSIRPRLLWRSQLNSFTVDVLDKHVQDIRGEPMPRLREPRGSREGRKWSRELEKCGL
ncbi:hypothetical protein OIV83_000038 [Microbotryomycetes sp. JL201]|nr:hypothetical protein OIV83_000038 [Microbotryomycetes sp. JL201]